MDSITRVFWWVHDPAVRKLHLLNWDTICKSKREGGRDERRRGSNLKNSGLSTKPCLQNNTGESSIYNPSSLLAKTFKAKYIPRTAIQDCEPKPLHSWNWRNIISKKNSLLGDGRWLVGKGFDIPLNHFSWFRGSPRPPNGGNFYLGTVTDLINNNTKAWKPRLS